MSINFSVSSLLTQEYLKDAKEIAIPYRERNRVLRMAETFPEADILLIHSLSDRRSNPNIEWQLMKDFNTVLKERFCLSLSSLEDCKTAKSNGIQFFLDYPFTSWFELNAYAKLKPRWVRLGSPLFFQLPAVWALGIPIRAIVNQAYSDGFARNDGRVGLWIRPEDLETYAEFIDMFEFALDPARDYEKNIRYLQAQFRIYKSKEWPGELGLLIQNFNWPCLNRMLYSEAIKARINCGHKCQIPGRVCHICNEAIRLADETQMTKYIKDMQELQD